MSVILAVWESEEKLGMLRVDRVDRKSDWNTEATYLRMNEPDVD